MGGRIIREAMAEELPTEMRNAVAVARKLGAYCESHGINFVCGMTLMDLDRPRGLTVLALHVDAIEVGLALTSAIETMMRDEDESARREG